MALKVADTDELGGWILSFGSQARVLSPESLRAKIKAARLVSLAMSEVNL